MTSQMKRCTEKGMGGSQTQCLCILSLQNLANILSQPIYMFTTRRHH